MLTSSEKMKTSGYAFKCFSTFDREDVYLDTQPVKSTLKEINARLAQGNMIPHITYHGLWQH